MSHYAAEVGIVKIKKEYRKEFGYLWNREFDKLSAPMFIEFLEDFPNGSNRAFSWCHGDVKTSWVGKYKTSYDEESGMFTYGVYYNEYGNGWEYWGDYKGILEEIEEEWFFEDWWDEPG
ncbi:MAG: hypothetical protein IJ794_00200 [Lachnospiraceae bacterium]|nr:hypothetical protein [Lachnospiraceae bacterium]